jgi:hypothetical protein
MRSEGIKSVVVTTAKPSGPGDLGQVAEGFYYVEGGILTMCDPDGRPLRDDNNGRQVALRLLPGDDVAGLAKKLTLQQYRAANRDQMAGFGRAIRYRDLRY